MGAPKTVSASPQTKMLPMYGRPSGHFLGDTLSVHGICYSPVLDTSIAVR
jgi:hypothetical protein